MDFQAVLTKLNFCLIDNFHRTAIYGTSPLMKDPHLDAKASEEPVTKRKATMEGNALSAYTALCSRTLAPA